LPSDTLQAEAMSTLVSALEWNYVATINEEGMLGGVESFIRNAKTKSWCQGQTFQKVLTSPPVLASFFFLFQEICISGSYTVSQTASEDDVASILTEMYKIKNSRGVVMFLQDHNIK
jgi:hypothetical protein